MDFVSTSKARLSKVVKQRVNMRMKTKDHLVHVISLFNEVYSFY